MNKFGIQIGNITIYYYSILILLGVIIGLYLALKEADKNGIGRSFISDLSFYVILFGIIGARIYYVVFNYSEYKNNFLDIFKIWNGGIAIYGAIIGGGIATYVYCKKKNKSFIKTIDTMVPSLIIAQAIGRWGNFFNHEAYGSIVSREFLERIHIPNFIIEEMYINGFYYHPTFLYESIWCLLGFILILFIRKLLKRKDGVVTYTYCIWYGIGRFFIEGLRMDSLYLFNFRVSQLVSIALVVLGIIGFVRRVQYEKTL